MMVYDFRSTILLVPFADMINYDTSFRSISNARFRQRFADACRICQPFQSVAPVESGILFLRELHISAGIALVASVWATATQSSISARGQHHSFITDQLFQDHQFRWRLESVSSCSWRPPPPILPILQIRRRVQASGESVSRYIHPMFPTGVCLE